MAIQKMSRACATHYAKVRQLHEGSTANRYLGKNLRASSVLHWCDSAGAPTCSPPSPAAADHNVVTCPCTTLTRAALKLVTYVLHMFTKYCWNKTHDKLPLIDQQQEISCCILPHSSGTFALLHCFVPGGDIVCKRDATNDHHVYFSTSSGRELALIEFGNQSYILPKGDMDISIVNSVYRIKLVPLASLSPTPKSTSYDAQIVDQVGDGKELEDVMQIPMIVTTNTRPIADQVGDGKESEDVMQIPMTPTTDTRPLEQHQIHMTVMRPPQDDGIQIKTGSMVVDAETLHKNINSNFASIFHHGDTEVLHKYDGSDDGTSGFRAIWGDDMQLGKGYHRESSAVADYSAISYRMPSSQAPFSCAANSAAGIITYSEDYVKAFTTNNTMSFEAWGVNLSPSFQHQDIVKLATKSVTAFVSTQFLSDPVILLDTQREDAHVSLKEYARKVLSEEGPVEFHRRYGSHFVCGYTTGGSFIGAYTMTYTSYNEAKSNEHKLQAGFRQWGLRVEGTHEFQTLINQTVGLQAQTGSYSCYGWSEDHPPKPIASLNDLAAACDKFVVKDGKKVHGILCRYTALDEYNKAKDEYMRGWFHPGAADYTPLFEPDYARVRTMLNEEYLKFTYIKRYLDNFDDDDDETTATPGVVIVRKQAEAAIDMFEDILRNADISGIRQTFAALIIYALHFHKRAPASNISDAVKKLYDHGCHLYTKIFTAKDLETKMHVELNKSDLIPGELDGKMFQVVCHPYGEALPVRLRWDIGQSSTASLMQSRFVPDDEEPCNGDQWSFEKLHDDSSHYIVRPALYSNWALVYQPGGSSDHRIMVEKNPDNQSTRIIVWQPEGVHRFVTMPLANGTTYMTFIPVDSYGTHGGAFLRSQVQLFELRRVLTTSTAINVD